MKKTTFIIFTIYTWMRILYGLIFYPYKTIREIVRKPIFVPVVLSPLIVIFLLFLLGKLGGLIIHINGFLRYTVGIILSTSLFSLTFWQIFIFYLLISLISAKRNE